MKEQRVRLYTRVSHEEQVKNGDSLDAQLKALKEHCKSNNYTIVNIYTDKGISASTVSKRAQFVQMLEDCESGELILFTKLDRFSRNLLDANIVVKDLEKKNVGIKAIHEDDIDTSTADGKFIFNLKLSLAQREREKTSERIKDVFKYKKSIGEVTSGSMPIGYKIENKRAVIDDDRVRIVVDAFEHYIATRSTRATKKYINDKYNLNMTQTSMTYMLKNEHYIGLDGYEPIIEKNTFKLAQDIRGNRTRQAKHEAYIFSGLLKCGQCGHNLCGCSRIRHTKKKGDYLDKYYRCISVGYASHKSCISINEKKLERIVLQELHKALESVNIQDTYISTSQDNSSAIERLQAKQKRIKELYIDGLIDRNEFDSRMEKVRKELEALEPQAPPSKILELDANALEIYKKFDVEQKSVFFKTFIKEIIVFRNEIKIVYI